MLRDTTEISSYGLIITAEHVTQMKGNKSAGYIYMDPHAFLALTSNADYNKTLMEEAETVEFYNKMARVGKNILPPWLDIECESHPLGKVLGHEGRHRAAACINAKVTKMPVFLVAKFGSFSVYRRLIDPNNPTSHSWRYVGIGDFPKYAIGHSQPVRERLELETWTGLYQ